MTKADSDNRIIDFDVLRVLAILFVIVLHAAATNWRRMDVNSYEWEMLSLFNGVSRWGVPVFVMISGSLFLNRDIGIRVLYKKYILRLVVAFVVWSFGYAFLFHIVTGHSVARFLITFIKGYYHLWFLYMIVGLYMITPLLKRIAADERMTRYFLVLALVFSILIPQFIGTIKVFYPGFGAWIESVIDQAHLKMVLGYSFYYVLGFQLSRARPGGRSLILICALGAVGFAATIACTMVVSQTQGWAIDIFYDELSLNVALEAICVFCLVRHICGKINFSDKSRRVIAALSKWSFGAYLVHVLIISLLGRLFGLGNLSFNPLLSIPAISIITFIVSFAISALLNRIPIVNKYLV